MNVEPLDYTAGKIVYRAALRDQRLPERPKRLEKALRELKSGSSG